MHFKVLCVCVCVCGGGGVDQFFLFFFQAVNRIPSRKNREMTTSFYSQVLQFEQAVGRE